MNIRVSIFQFDIEWLNPQKNISLVRKRLETIGSDIDLMVLPEMFLTGFCMDPSKSAIREDGSEIEELIDISKEFSTTLIGSLAIVEDDKFYNRALLISENGIIGRYDKQFLFSPSGESAIFASKYDTNLMTYGGWTILPQICYDLRFPENVRQLPAPDLLIYMANWPTPRIHHWDALLKARAIENQCFTIGCNRTGRDGNDWDYPGHSAVYSPDGAIMESDQKSTKEVSVLSLSELKDYRTKYRFLEDKKV